MTNSYKFSISTEKVGTMTVQGVELKDVVTSITNVHCSAVSEDKVEGPSVYSSQCPKELDLPDPNNYTPIGELTYDEVCGWAEKLLGSEEWANLKERADDKLAEWVKPNKPAAGPSFAPAK